jgi:hypothetical protein
MACDHVEFPMRKKKLNNRFLSPPSIVHAVSKLPSPMAIRMYCGWTKLNLKSKSVAGSQLVAAKTSMAGGLFASSKTSYKLIHIIVLNTRRQDLTAALVIPMPFHKPSHTGSTLARASAIPTAALVAPILSCGSVRKANTLAGAGVTPTATLPCLDCARGYSWFG